MDGLGWAEPRLEFWGAVLAMLAARLALAEVNLGARGGYRGYFHNPCPSPIARWGEQVRSHVLGMSGRVRAGPHGSFCASGHVWAERLVRCLLDTSGRVWAV